MSAQDDDGQQKFALGLVFALVLLVVAGVIGLAIGKGRGAKAPAAPATAVAAAPATMAAPAASAPVAAASAPAGQAAADAASVKVENGVVKFYFASGKSDLAAGATEAMSEVVKAGKAGKKLVISGFHDSTGDAAKNAALAKDRAVAVQGALKAAGVPEKQIELKKPEQTLAGGSDAEARRVEISVQ